MCNCIINILLLHLILFVILLSTHLLDLYYMLGLGLSQQRGTLNPKPRVIVCDVVVVADDDDFIRTVVFILPCRADSSDCVLIRQLSTESLL